MLSSKLATLTDLCVHIQNMAQSRSDLKALKHAGEINEQGSLGNMQAWTQAQSETIVEMITLEL